MCFDSGNVIQMHMLTACESITAVTEMFAKAAAIPTTQEWCEMMTQAEVVLDSYQALNDWALAKGMLLFHIVMKHHTFLQLIENAQSFISKIHMVFQK